MRRLKGRVRKISARALLKNFIRPPYRESVVRVLKRLGESGGLSTAVRLVYVAAIENARYENLAYALPLQERNRALIRNAHPVKYAHVVLFATGYERALFA